MTNACPGIASFIVCLFLMAIIFLLIIWVIVHRKNQLIHDLRLLCNDAITEAEKLSKNHTELINKYEALVDILEKTKDEN